jgi:hypothetical protein
MVPLGSLTPCDANTSMQRQGIKHPITPRAPSVGSSVGNTKSVPQFSNEHGWLHTLAAHWGGSKEGATTRLSFGQQQSLLCGRGPVKLQVPCCQVHLPNQSFLALR